MTSNFDPIGPGAGRTDYDSEDVVIVKDPSGRAVITPRSVQRLDGEQQAELRNMTDAAMAVQAALDALEQSVESAREAGLSWSVIGWAVGTTGEAARQRWGAPPEPDL